MDLIEIIEEKEAKKSRPPRRKQFDSLWSSQAFKKRGVKYLLTPTNDQQEIIKQYQLLFQEAVSYFVNKIHELILAKKVSLEAIKKSRDSKFYDQFWKESEASKYLDRIGFNKARQRRGVCFVALRLLRGYLQRNKALSKNAPRLRHTKATFFEDGIIKDNFPKDATGNLRISIHGKDEKGKIPFVNVDYEVPKSMARNKPHLPVGSIGGNLVHNKNCWSFMALATVPIKWLYEPVGELGFDLNKTSKYFITFSKSIVLDGKEIDRIPHSVEIKKQQKRLKDLNDAVGSKEIRSKQRRAIRRKIRKAHFKLEALCKPICETIVTYIKEHKELLCIDPLACGARTGSFGQDKMVALLTRMCEEQSLPFVHVPTPYTSKACYTCGAKGERPDPDKVICPNCGEIAAHYNAAKNIAKWGRKIWEEGVFKFQSWVKKYKTKAPEQAVEVK